MRSDIYILYLASLLMDLSFEFIYIFFHTCPLHAILDMNMMDFWLIHTVKFLCDWFGRPDPTHIGAV